MKEMYLSGNNGGDYVKITQTKEQEGKDLCFIEVGHCCVVVMRHQVPVEFITSLFYGFMVEEKNGFSRKVDASLKDFAKEVMQYPKDFTEERLSHIKKIKIFE